MVPVFKKPRLPCLLRRRCRECTAASVLRLVGEKDGYPSSNRILLAVCERCHAHNVFVLRRDDTGTPFV